MEGIGGSYWGLIQSESRKHVERPISKLEICLHMPMCVCVHFIRTTTTVCLPNGESIFYSFNKKNSFFVHIYPSFSIDLAIIYAYLRHHTITFILRSHIVHIHTHSGRIIINLWRTHSPNQTHVNVSMNSNKYANPPLSPYITTPQGTL